MIERILGVFKLDRAVFAEVEHDESATTQAAIVVAIVAALSVVGTILQSLLTLVRGGELQIGGLLLGIVVTFVLAFVNWAVWSGVTYLVGTRLFKGEATLQEMLRVIGFASAPRMLQIIPCIGGIVGSIWALIASYFAIKEGLDLDDTGTIVTILVGWLITVVIGFLVGLLGVGGAMGVGALSGLLGG
ncbi:MAG: YIP1 family protein [Anaerolineae bacterium]|nr:YIP1 family protein [Anaerolineae bacterium]